MKLSLTTLLLIVSLSASAQRSKCYLYILYYDKSETHYYDKSFHENKEDAIYTTDYRIYETKTSQRAAYTIQLIHQKNDKKIVVRTEKLNGGLLYNYKHTFEFPYDNLNSRSIGKEGMNRILGGTHIPYEFAVTFVSGKFENAVINQIKMNSSSIEYIDYFLF
ncbi:MAG: hypothetical protein JJ909_00895 [Roseivirga sp.]|uniref:hypothetical protein n=1 Tax=Roseivirga sp. TaxID=1964215 RepID=UPI001B110407|nr:hypothetical protein [Roseivirga sp.]MBO6659619.1 hypothetical protein [Roseivirga sp.]MBO6759519.1 hypothetical protein [Roseivirga sp.]MBO6907644.1 hypothetical protein [Roseivirga sp.]